MENNWWISFRSPADIWENHASFLIGEYAIYLGGLLTLVHALTNGKRYAYMWLTTILHGLVVEMVSYYMPDIDNFWHAQSTVMLLGQRLPLHIVFFYPSIIYTAAASVARMHLKSWAEPFAVGLGAVLIDVPFDIMGIKLLWWSWHDTDPNIFDRHYWVPWTSYFFHASFSMSFTLLFHGTRRLFTSTAKYQSAGVLVELVCCAITALLTFPLATIQFVFVYHTLHDSLLIHTEVCVLLLVTVYGLIVWLADRHHTPEARDKNKGGFDPLGIWVAIHFLLYIVLVVVEHPENIRSVGVHETPGNCSHLSPVRTALGQVFSKRTFLCLSQYSEDYYDFHCLDKEPDEGQSWYTLCGTAFSNHAEYILVVSAFSLLGLFVYLQMLRYSGRQPGPQSQQVKGHAAPKHKGKKTN